MSDLPNTPKSAALSQTAGVPEGWKLVPVEPTAAMCDAMRISVGDGIAMKPVYRAMLAAAPAASGGDDRLTRAEAIAEFRSRTAASVSERARESDPLLGAYMTWPDDIRKKLSMHDLRRMGGWAPRPDPADWRIDTSAGGPILVYQNCSVIEGEQARYVLGLIARDAALEQALTQQRGECVAEVVAVDPVSPFDHRRTWSPDRTLVWSSKLDGLGCLNLPIGTKLYTTPQPSADAVRELVERWRANGHPYVSDCADELESLLSAASGEKGVGGA